MLQLNLEYKDKYTFFFPVRWKHQLTEHHDVRSLKTNATKVQKKIKKYIFIVSVNSIHGAVDNTYLDFSRLLTHVCILRLKM